LLISARSGMGHTGPRPGAPSVKAPAPTPPPERRLSLVEAIGYPAVRAVRPLAEHPAV